MLKENAVNFLLYSYFELEQSELIRGNEKAIMKKCAQRAYGDLCRTLEFARKESGSKKADEKREIRKEHQDFCDEICDKIVQAVEHLLSSDPQSFDENHKRICGEICTTANASDALKLNEYGKEAKDRGEPLKFYYGQAQKWLNMTLKYMWLLGLWEDQFEKLVEVMHVPVDSYIMEAAAAGAGTKGKEKEKQNFQYGLALQVPNLSWSKWNEDEYTAFQMSLREQCKGMHPIAWEGSAWIEIAKARKERENGLGQAKNNRQGDVRNAR